MNKKVAVLTSGGDAPGMNAAVRAIVRTGLYHGYEMYGVYSGFEGLVTGDIEPLSAREVGGVMQSAGTFLGSARSVEFTTEAGQKKALSNLETKGIGSIVVIGGNGSQKGSYELSKAGLAVVGVASTIDNDLSGSDITIGVDTALNIALESIDRLRVTATSHRRGLLVEVMGRHCGYLALMAGLAGGAEAIVIPEQELSPEDLADRIQKAHERGKKHALTVVAEGARNNARKLVEYFAQNKHLLGFELRATILGHVQRGGTPTAFDRLLATRLGVTAMETLVRGEHGVLVGLMDNRPGTTPLSEVVGKNKPLDLGLLEMAGMLSK
ncbi:MAG TPA: ATP-dependent 6-phosphofructokinase [Terriglobia bacterium]|nr:ATP-dependent 6-phosphofructokinase [Terriglobia bacterium]